jgi:hypothetical protein
LQTAHDGDSRQPDYFKNYVFLPFIYDDAAAQQHKANKPTLGEHVQPNKQ